MIDKSSDDIKHENMLRFSETCKKSFGVSFEDLMQDILFKAINAMPCSMSVEARMQSTMKSMLEMKPKDPVEAKLCAKEAAIYSLAMQYVARAEKGMFSEDSNEASRMWYETNMSFAIKLLRLHNETVETLGRYRRGGEQRVNVTHSVVAEKAIVNNFGVEGVSEKSKEKPHGNDEILRREIENQQSSALPVKSAPKRKVPIPRRPKHGTNRGRSSEIV